MRSANIKNLSIALEALSRVQGVDMLFTNIQHLIEDEIKLMKEDQHPLQTYTPKAPDQDEIPF